MNLAPYPDAKYSIFPTLKQLGACIISCAMNISLNIFKNVPRALGPNEYAVIFKMLLCQYHDISSKSNRCTSPKSIFVCVIAMELPETLNKDKHVEGLPKSRPSHQSVTQSLN